MSYYQRYDEAFRYIAENVKECKNPESFQLWRKESKNAVSYTGNSRDFSATLDRRMNNIAKKWNVEGYTFLEKVRLVFIFSWPVSDKFVKMVQYEKCTIKLDQAKRIKYFRSKDGSVVLSADHNEEEKIFKGTLLTAKRQRSLLFAGNSKEVRASQPTDPGPAKNSNEKLENPDSEESESEDEAPTNVSDDLNSELSRNQNGPINERIEYDELDEQESGEVAVLNEERSVDRKPEKRSQNSGFSENAKRVKIEELDKDLFGDTAPEALNDPEEPKISVLLLANQIGITALYCDLEDVQKKASQAIEMIKMEKREMTSNVADFNSFVDLMLKSFKRSRIRYSGQTKKFLPLQMVYRHLKLSLILPFGAEVMQKALEILDKQIEELGESQEEVPLETIRGNLEYLLNWSTGLWI
ncbi:hypothetical protein B9Z55_027802 [Caenorhabditis nigoni]|uniref:SPK domain-containing protein n=1 Tax=Caenorhabditis nigoni TaxID=1611254 RepID=A0A2G5SEB0_9PELO|nr:hypothetical protein B9Z55_027802 [Caenorhabditis nigoni]